MLHPLASDERQTVDLDTAPAVTWGHHQMLEPRHRGASGRPERTWIGRNLSPRDHVEAFGLHDPADLVSRARRRVSVGREEGHADGVLTSRGEVVADNSSEESVGNLNEDARPVSGVGLGSCGPSMLKVRERSKTREHQFMASSSLDIRDEGHPARVVLKPWVVQAATG